MVDTRKIPHAIQWHEGMLLAPQHFQQFALRSEELLSYHTASATPFYWGIRHLKIDAALLVSGVFRVLELEAVMPDGLIVVHGHEEDGPLEINISERVEEIRLESLTIHLAVPENTSGISSFKGSLARFKSVEGNYIHDSNTGEGELQIPRLKPCLTLLATENPPKKYSSFPISRVAHKNEAFTLSNFVPPMLSVTLNSPLGEMCSVISKRIREKAAFLSEQVRSPALTTGSPLLQETKSMIHNLVSALPQFEAVLNTGVIHPFILYQSLCRLVGQLSYLGSGMTPPVLDSYNHNDLRNNFEQCREFIIRMVDEGVHETYSSIPFSLQDDVFTVDFSGDWMTRTVFLGMHIPTSISEKEVSLWVENSWIGSKSKIPAMRQKRILGPERQAVDGEADITPARGMVLFRLTVDPQFIVPNEELQLFNTAEPNSPARPSEVLLYVKNQ